MLKSIFRSSAIQGLLGWMVWVYFLLVAKTTKWNCVGLDVLEEHWTNEEGLLLACWHSRIVPMAAIPAHFAKKWRKPKLPAAMIISLSRDGAFVAKANERLGMQPIRGSSTNKKKLDKEKNGREALKIASKHVRNGGVVTLTPDGPRGPREICGLGTIRIAQLTGAPVLPWGASCSPSKRLDTWDRFLLPRLFAKGAIVVGDPIYIDRKMDVEVARIKVETALRNCTAEADKLCGLGILPPRENTTNAFRNDA